MEVQGRFKRNEEGKYLDCNGKNERRKEKESSRKKGRDINYAEMRWILQKNLNCETAVNKGYVRSRYVRRLCVNTWAHNYYD